MDQHVVGCHTSLVSRSHHFWHHPVSFHQSLPLFHWKPTAFQPVSDAEVRHHVLCHLDMLESSPHHQAVHVRNGHHDTVFLQPEHLCVPVLDHRADRNALREDEPAARNKDTVALSHGLVRIPFSRQPLHYHAGEHFVKAAPGIGYRSYVALNKLFVQCLVAVDL